MTWDDVKNLDCDCRQNFGLYNLKIENGNLNLLPVRDPRSRGARCRRREKWLDCSRANQHLGRNEFQIESWFENVAMATTCEVVSNAVEFDVVWLTRLDDVRAGPRWFFVLAAPFAITPWWENQPCQRVKVDDKLSIFLRFSRRQKRFKRCWRRLFCCRSDWAITISGAQTSFESILAAQAPPNSWFVIDLLHSLTLLKIWEYMISSTWYCEARTGIHRVPTFCLTKYSTLDAYEQSLQELRALAHDASEPYYTKFDDLDIKNFNFLSIRPILLQISK